MIGQLAKRSASIHSVCLQLNSDRKLVAHILHKGQAKLANIASQTSLFSS